jgi:hypothetical protein
MNAASEWARCKHWIAAALPYTRGALTIEDVEAGLLSGRFMLWPGPSAAAITEFNEYPRLTALNIFLVGGDRAGMRQLLPAIREFAKRSGCKRMEAGGRKGFERIAESFGFTHAWSLFIEEL